jgi:steroid 5-alpha reductase family enzyme
MSEPATLFLMLLGTALAVSAVGFRRLVWFISVGYGYSIAAMAVVLGCLAGAGMPWLLAAQLVLLLLYGLRLGTHVLVRDYKTAYRQVVKATYGELVAGFGKSLAIWTAVSLLYVLMFSPAAFRAPRPKALSLVALAGLVLMAGGLGLEGLADWQKSAAKTVAPDRFCDRGLFAWVRCPAYLGEILFWIGSW